MRGGKAMKKRFLTFILTIATMLMCIFGFSACGGNVEFKINFVVENEVYATVSTSGNEVISMPENPTKDDYTFDGWYWDEGKWQNSFKKTESCRYWRTVSYGTTGI